MKLFGYLFVVAVVLGLVGLARGWFTVVAATSSGSTAVQLRVDGDKIVKDTAAAKDGVIARGHGASAGRIPSTTDAAAASDAGPSIVGRITAVDATTQDLTLDVTSQRSVYHMSPDVVITREGATIASTQLRPDMRARLHFATTGSSSVVNRVEILP